MRARSLSVAVRIGWGCGVRSDVTLSRRLDFIVLADHALGDDKGRLQPAPGEQGTGNGAALLGARNQWVRVVNALVANNELAGLDEETDKLIFGPLRAAEKAADRRGGSAVAKKKAEAVAAVTTEAAAGEATATK